MAAEIASIRLDQQVFQQTLEKKLADLPPLPAVVTRIMQTVNDPRSAADELNRLISLDQGLSSKMLRIVNSAYYGFPRRISTITHAVVILGFNTVRNLVLGVSAFGMLSHKTSRLGLDRVRFWQHCVGSAVAARLLAKRCRLSNREALEEAFIAGLLHDIGELFLDCYFPAQYALTMSHAGQEGMPMLEAERALLGVDHGTVGRRIAGLWNFPPLLASTMGEWPAPEPATEHFEFAAVIHAADWLAWQAGLGTYEQIPGPGLSPGVAAWLALGEDETVELTQEVQTQFAAARDMFALQD